MMCLRSFRLLCLLFCLCSFSFSQEPGKSKYDKTPAELQPIDPETRRLIKNASDSAESGNADQAIAYLEQAVALSTSRGSANDSAIAEEALAAARILQGRWREAQELEDRALEHAIAASNDAARAEIILSKAIHPSMALENSAALGLADDALRLANRSKSKYVISHALAERSKYLLSLGRVDEARANIDEALEIETINGFDNKALHLIYRSQILESEKAKPEDVIASFHGALSLAIAKQSYVAAILAFSEVMQRRLRDGNAREVRDAIISFQAGTSPISSIPITNQPAFRAALSLPLSHILISVLSEQAAYALNDFDAAIKIAVELQSYGHSIGFLEVEAGASEDLARVYEKKQDIESATGSWTKAIDVWEGLHSDLRAENAELNLAGLLERANRQSDVVPVLKRLILSADKNKNHELSFSMRQDLAIAYSKLEKLEEAEAAMFDAEPRLNVLFTLPDADLTKVSNRAIGFYVQFSDIHRRQQKWLREISDYEHAIIAAEDANNKDAWQKLKVDLKKIFEIVKPENLADKAYNEGRLTDALEWYEIINAFNRAEIHFGDREPQKPGTSDPVFDKLIDIAWRLAQTDKGASQLESNLREIGWVANPIRIIANDALMRFYLRSKDFERADHFGQEAIGAINLKAQSLSRPYVDTVCLAAWASYLNSKKAQAEEGALTCLHFATGVGAESPQTLQAAQTFASRILQFTHPEEALGPTLALLDKNPDNADELERAGNIYSVLGELSKAIEQWTKALALYEKKNDSGSAAKIHINLGNALMLIDRKDKSGLAHFDSALSLYKRLNDFVGIFKAEIYLAGWYSKIDSKKEALDHVGSAQVLLSLTTDKSQRALGTGLVANVYSNLGEFDRALHLHTEASEIYRGMKDSNNEAWQMGRIGDDLNALGRRDEALATYLKAKSIADSTSDEVVKYWATRQVASALENKGEYENAIQLYKAARTIATNGSDKLGTAQSDCQIWRPFSVVGEWEEALKFAQEGLSISRDIKNPGEEFTCLESVMNIYGDRRSTVKDLKAAFLAYDDASGLSKNHSALSLDRLADTLVEMYWQSGRFDEGITFAKVAIHRYHQEKEILAEGASWLALAELQSRKGDQTAANASVRNAEPLIQKSSDVLESGRLLYVKAGIARRSDQLELAVKFYEQVVDAIDKVKSGSDVDQVKKIREAYSFVYDELLDAIRALWEKSAPGQQSSLAFEALRYSEINKSREFSNSWGRLFAQGLRSKLPAEYRERETRVFASNSGENEDAFIKEVRLKYPAYASVRFPQDISIDNLALKSGQTLLEFKMADDALYIWLVQGATSRPKLHEFKRIERPRKWFEDRISELRDEFNSGHPDSFSTATLEELTKAMFSQEDVQFLQASSSVVVVQDGPLFLLPLEMLSLEASGGNYPLMQVDTNYFPSLQAFVFSRTQTIDAAWNHDFFGVGDPITVAGSSTAARSATSTDDWSEISTRGFTFGRIPATADEIRHIAGLFNQSKDATVTKLAEAATKRSLVDQDLSGFRFVHLATHGILPVGTAPKEPGLVFSTDGTSNSTILWASEVLSLNLHPEMVVLSACNTGSGRVSRAEGVSNLGRAFLLAGASSATVSLWQVADDSTALFMTEFYRDILAGNSKGRALAMSRKYLHDHGYQSPFYWAPFVLMGE